jgi:hypothetical protein
MYNIRRSKDVRSDFSSLLATVNIDDTISVDWDTFVRIDIDKEETRISVDQISRLAYRNWCRTRTTDSGGACLMSLV